MRQPSSKTQTHHSNPRVWFTWPATTTTSAFVSRSWDLFRIGVKRYALLGWSGSKIFMLMNFHSIKFFKSINFFVVLSETVIAFWWSHKRFKSSLTKHSMHFMHILFKLINMYDPLPVQDIFEYCFNITTFSIWHIVNCSSK